MSQPASRTTSQLPRLLDSLRDDLHAELARERDRAAQQPDLTRLDAGEQRAVELDHMRMELLEVADPRVPRAEVVDRELHAGVADGRNAAPGGLVRLHEDALGQLEAQERRVEPVRRQRGEHVVGERRIAKLAAGNVDADDESIVQGCPGCSLAARRVEDEAADLDDAALVLGNRHELGRRHEAERRMVPAEERLEPFDAPVAQVERRLVDELELVVEQPATQIGGEAEPALRRLVQMRREEREPAAALPLRAVHGEVGVAEELVRRVAGRDADAGAQPQLARVDLDRRHHLAEQSPAERVEPGPVGDECRDRELVAAETRHQLVRPDAAIQAHGDLDQERIPGAVAEAVVERLEVVEVEEEERLRHARLLVATEQLEQLAAVRQVGERVGDREDAQLLFGEAPP